MRTFIAIELSDEIRDVLAKAQAHLKYAGADVKWVEPHNIHLTLKFLGEIDERKCDEVKSILDSIASQTHPFEISIKDIGAFPKIEYPRVIWIGLDKGASEAAELAKETDERLSKIGFQKENRSFAAHLTIGRVRSPKNREALKEKVQSCQLSLSAEALAKAEAISPQLAKSVILFQSTLTPSGPIYTKLHEAWFTVAES